MGLGSGVAHRVDLAKLLVATVPWAGLFSVSLGRAHSSVAVEPVLGHPPAFSMAVEPVLGGSRLRRSEEPCRCRILRIAVLELLRKVGYRGPENLRNLPLLVDSL